MITLKTKAGFINPREKYLCCQHSEKKINHLLGMLLELETNS